MHWLRFSFTRFFFFIVGCAGTSVIMFYLSDELEKATPYSFDQ